jgi:hypothetical protein
MHWHTRAVVMPQWSRGSMESLGECLWRCYWCGTKCVFLQHILGTGHAHAKVKSGFDILLCTHIKGKFLNIVEQFHIYNNVKQSTVSSLLYGVSGKLISQDNQYKKYVTDLWSRIYTTHTFVFCNLNAIGRNMGVVSEKFLCLHIKNKMFQ